MNTHPEPTDHNHPLTEAAAAELSKKFMPGVAFQMLANVSPEDLTEYARLAYDLGREHERANPDDDRPWEPLNGPVRVGDEVRQDYYGITHTAVVGRVDEDGDPWSTEDGFIGQLDLGTWYVRRPVQELPTEDGAVIVPADGHEYITATFAGEVYRAREAILRVPDHWRAAWRSDTSVMAYVISGWIDPSAWKVGNR